MEGSLQLGLLALPESIANARRRVADLARKNGVAERVVDDARLATSEAVTNAVRHAYDDAPGLVDVVVSVDAGELVVVVRDFGRGIRRDERTGHAVGAVSGYGLPLIDALTDECTISSDSDGGTTVRMVFHLDGHLEQGAVR